MNRFLFIFSLCLALSWAQADAIWHGVEHPFHTDEVCCDLHFTIEKQGYAPFFSTALIQPFEVKPYFGLTSFPNNSHARPFLAFLPRAPPLFSTCVKNVFCLINAFYFIS